jgi:hypothetical protein
MFHELAIHFKSIFLKSSLDLGFAESSSGGNSFCKTFFRTTFGINDMRDFISLVFFWKEKRFC